MADTLEQSLDALKLALSIVGLTTSVTIDSGIFAHNGDDIDDDDIGIDGVVGRDVFVIPGSTQNPISLQDVVTTFERIQRKFDLVDDGRSFFYEGIDNKGNNYYRIFWGS